MTEFTFRLHPVAEIYGGPMFFELSDGPDILGYFNEFIQTAPRDYGGFPAFQMAPPLPFVPESRVGEPFVAVVSCWSGSIHDGEKILQGFRDVANPVAEMVGAMPYPALNSAFDALVPPGLQHYWKAAFVGDLSADAIRTHMEHGSRVPVVNSTVHLYPINGACHDVAPDATAFGHRDATYAAVIAGMWPDPGGQRSQHGVGQGLLSGYRAALPGGRIRQLRLRRRPVEGGGELRLQLCPAAGGQGCLRSRQPVPSQPEYRAQGVVGFDHRRPVLLRGRPSLARWTASRRIELASTS